MWSFNYLLKDPFFRTLFWCFLKPNLSRKKLMFLRGQRVGFSVGFCWFFCGPLPSNGINLFGCLIFFILYFLNLLYGALWASSTTRWIKLIISKVLVDQFLILVDSVLLPHYALLWLCHFNNIELFGLFSKQVNKC